MTRLPGRVPTPSKEVARREEILRAAIEVFSKKGYRGCRIADVAKEAGIAYGLVYHYFHNKDELLESVFQRGWSAFIDRLKGAVAEESTLDEQIHAIVRIAFESYKNEPRTVKVLILEVGRSPAGGHVNRGTAFGEVIALSSQLFRVAQQEGAVDPALDPRLCAAMLFGAIEMGLTVLVLGILDRTDEAVVNAAAHQVADSFLHGLSLPKGKREPWPSMKSTSKFKAARAS